jgi:uncharacterized protein YeaO (DUF488 family)
VPIRTKRWNDPREQDDGYRLLVCRYRPRGVRREGEPWDAWCPELSPSIELHAAAYGKDGSPPIAWEEYTGRYLDEMSAQGFWIRGFAERLREGETITLLCSSACVDAARCHRTLLAKRLEDEARPPEATPAAARTRIHRRAR